MKMEINLEANRAEVILEGRSLVISRRGPETRLEGLNKGEGDNTFGGMVASILLNFVSTTMDGMNALIDETDDCAVWEPLPGDLVDHIYDMVDY